MINEPDRVRELVRALTVVEADAVIDALAATRTRTVVTTSTAA